jgi:hypothetical protein
MDLTDEQGETTNGSSPDRRPEPEVVPAPSDAPGRSPFDLNAQQKKVLIVVLVVHLILARFTLRDLRRRPAAAVRGPKRLWRVWATTNTSGSVAYWLVGRRRGAMAPLDPEA